MDRELIKSKILHLREVEKLSLRQISQVTGINRKRVQRIIAANGEPVRQLRKDSIVEAYRNLIAHWFKERPKLKALQIYERLKSYGYTGSYPSVVRFSRQYRQVKPQAYHPLIFLPGEEAQVDWFSFKHEQIGDVYGFLYVLAYSRYAWGKFYRRTGFEFFITGHLECFRHLNGLAHRHRYDNVKTVVLQRYPEIRHNPQFLDFARFYKFTIYLCNPYKGNEKGRVERPIRDVRDFLYAQTTEDLDDLNNKFQEFLRCRNNRIHRSTGKTPQSMLAEEKLLSLPAIEYAPAARIIPVAISKTALAQFEKNKYSVPSSCAGKTAQLLAYPEKIEICVDRHRVASHKRCFETTQMILNPLHSEQLLNRSPDFKMRRILQLIQNMHEEFQCFLQRQENDNDKLQAAYQLFVFLRTNSRETLISAVRELNRTGCLKIKALHSILHLPQPKPVPPVWPKNEQLLNLDYQPRKLEDYDQLK